MPGYTVHVFAVGRFKVVDVQAETPEAAGQAAGDQLDLYRLFERLPAERPLAGVEFSEEITHYLVDEADDPEYERSRRLWHDGETPLPSCSLNEEGTRALADLAHRMKVSQDELACQLKGGARLGVAEDTGGHLWVIAHFWSSGAVDLYPALGGLEEPSVEQCIEIVGDNWQAGHRLEPYGPFPMGAQLPRID